MHFYESPCLPWKQTQWRVIVVAAALFSGARITHYQWRVKGTSGWQSLDDWALWDPTTLDAGLPPVCAALWKKYEADLRAILADQPLPMPAQPSLFT
jgi:hypothetical protein